MKSVYRFTLALSVCLLLITPFALQAQTTGTIEGQVTDQSGAALPGVTVELASPALQGAKTVSTAADGKYRFLSLNPGTYTVTATLTGFGKVQKKATVTLDAVSSVSFQLSLSASAEVVVTGEAPVVDTTTAESGLQINESVVQKLPVGRNYASAVLIQPGVSQDLSETQGRGVTGGGLTIYGSTSVENQYLVDGVNTTNVVKGFEGKALSNEFIQEVQVKASGYEAEYGRAMGGIVNVITKSGGNEFHGDAFGYFNTTGLTADYKGTSNVIEDPIELAQHGRRAEHRHRRFVRHRSYAAQPAGLRRGPRRILHQGPPLVLRRLQPRHVQPGADSSRRWRVPDGRPESSLRQHVEHLLRQADRAARPGHDPRRHGVRRPGNAYREPGEPVLDQPDRPQGHP